MLMVWLGVHQRVSSGVPFALGDVLPEKLWGQAYTKSCALLGRHISVIAGVTIIRRLLPVIKS